MISEKDLLIFDLIRTGHSMVEVAEILDVERTVIRKIYTELERRLLKEKRKYNIE